MMNRREFHRRLATGVSALCAAQHLTATAAPRGKKATKYIDVHTHVGTIWNGNKELTASLLVHWMDEHDVAKAVVLPLTSPESSSFLCLTEGCFRPPRNSPIG